MPEASTSTVDINAKRVNIKRNHNKGGNKKKMEVIEVKTHPPPKHHRGRRGGKKLAKNDGTVGSTVPVADKVHQNPVAATILSSKLADDAKDWAHAYLDPTSQWMTVPSHVRIPDGAMPNSTAMCLRGGLNCYPPGMPTMLNPQQSVPLDGRMWTLTIIQLPLFRHPYILVANMLSGEMSEEDQDFLAAKWNNTSEPPVYPTWEVLNEATSSFWSVINWTALKDVALPDPHSSLPSEIKGYRMTAIGLNANFNVPDLVNQGVAVAGQWSFDFGTAEAVMEHVVKINHHSGRWQIIQNSTVWTYSLDIRIPCEVQETIISNSTRAFMVRQDYNNFVRSPSASTNQFCFPRFFFNNASQNNSATHTFVTSENLVFTDDTSATWDIPAGTTISCTYAIGSGGNVTPAVTVTMSCTITVDDVEVPLTLFSSQVVPGALVSTALVRPAQDAITDSVEGMKQMVTTFGLPPVGMQTMIQSSPKTVVFLLKNSAGCYLPARIFEPQFMVQNAAEARPICMGRPGVFPTAGGPIDTVDRNFGVSVMVLSGISWSAAPMLKFTRDFEVIANDNTLLQLTMTIGEDLCQRVIEFVRSVTNHHPFAYPATYNCFGVLAKAIEGMLESLPVDRIAGPILNSVVKAVTDDKSVHNNASKLKRVIGKVTANLAR